MEVFQRLTFTRVFGFSYVLRAAFAFGLKSAYKSENIDSKNFIVIGNESRTDLKFEKRLANQKSRRSNSDSVMASKIAYSFVYIEHLFIPVLNSRIDALFYFQTMTE